MPKSLVENVHLQNAFRADINILRAIAVLSVIFFHFDFDLARGGYAGVDIFFVISGYLMTSIILSRFEKNSFSFASFYMSRLLRIVPPLAIMCLILLVIGWFLIFPYDYAYLNRNINHALVFKSNISFSKGAGYFDIGKDIKWLLHTWSLSVEMQFYIVYPIFLILIRRFLGLNPLRIILLGVTILSLAAYLWTYFYGNANHAFYLLPFRAWELLAGALIVVFPFRISANNFTNRRNQFFRVFGALLIALAVLLADGNSQFSTVWAFLVTIGTAFILATSRISTEINNPFIKRFSHVIHYCGLISYSLYLWHWPIRSLQEYFGYEDSLIITLLALLLTYLFGALSFHLVERKTSIRVDFSRLFSRKLWTAVIVLIVPSMLAYGAAKVVRENDGVVQRLGVLPYNNIPTYLFENPELYLLEGIADKCGNNGRACQFTNGEKIPSSREWKPDLILVGDSHAVAIAHALSETPKDDRHLKVLLSASAGCIYVENFDQTRTGTKKYEKCKDAYRNFTDILEKTPHDTPLLMVNYYKQYLKAEKWKKIWYRDKIDLPSKPVDFSKAWLNMVCNISAQRKVYILRTVPIMKEPVIHKIVQSVLQGTTEALEQTSFSISAEVHSRKTEDERRLLNTAVKQCGVELIDPSRIFCKNGACFGVSSENIPYYRDATHLSLYGSRKLIPLFSEFFSN
ncbi:MAG: acyltransferase family protein [Sneathiella sp.]